MKNFLTKLGLVEDDMPVAKAKPAAPTATTNVSTGTPIPSSTSFSFSVPAPSIDPALNEMLTKSLEENKLAGFDYLKFISAVQETKSTGLAEEACYKVTFSTAKQLGVDKNSLLKSGQHYIDVLNQDENDFNADCAEYERAQVQAREAKLAKVESTIADLKKQLSQLTEDSATLTQELHAEKAKLDSRKAAFSVTLDTLRNTIKTNIDKIGQYLQ